MDLIGILPVNLKRLQDFSLATQSEQTTGRLQNRPDNNIYVGKRFE